MRISGLRDYWTRTDPLCLPFHRVWLISHLCFLGRQRCMGRDAPYVLYATQRQTVCCVTTFNAAFSPQTNTLLRSGCNMAATGHETRSSYGQCRMRQRQIVAGGRNEHVPQPVNQHVLLRPCPEPSTDEGGKGCKGKGDCVRRQGLRR